MPVTFTVQTVGAAASRRRPPYFKTKKLALLGSTQSLQYTPWFDPSWTLAAHPCCRGACKREPDWYFDLHPPSCFRQERKSWMAKYYSWLKAIQTPIFMQEDWPDVPMAVRYPLERVEAEFANSVTGRIYATNHCAYLIPLAMMEGVTTIGLFGCQYSSDAEHSVQRDSLTYWLGRFEQWGGRIVVPKKYNSLLSQPRGLYGYESHDGEGKLKPEWRGHNTPTVTKATVSGGETKHPLRLIGARDLPTLPVPEGYEPPNPWPELVGATA